MKYCPNCRLSYDDTVNNCPQCGAQTVYIAPQQTVDPSDHTAEFTAKDISDNKVLAMLPYVMGWIGIIITLIASSTSPYAAFHVKQALKIQVISALSVFLAIIPIIGWLAIGVVNVIALVINLIQFFSVCAGKAKEPAIIKNFSFLK